MRVGQAHDCQEVVVEVVLLQWVEDHELKVAQVVVVELHAGEEEVEQAFPALEGVEEVEDQAFPVLEVVEEVVDQVFPVLEVVEEAVDQAFHVLEVVEEAVGQAIPGREVAVVELVHQMH